MKPGPTHPPTSIVNSDFWNFLFFAKPLTNLWFQMRSMYDGRCETMIKMEATPCRRYAGTALPLGRYDTWFSPLLHRAFLMNFHFCNLIKRSFIYSTILLKSVAVCKLQAAVPHSPLPLIAMRVSTIIIIWRILPCDEATPNH